MTDPALQAEIANPADANAPTGEEAGERTAADEGPIDAPGAPGELHSDETPPQDGAEEPAAGDADPGAVSAAPTTTGDETGAEGVQGPDAVEPADAEPAAPASDQAAPATDATEPDPTTGEQPPATDERPTPALPHEAAQAPDDATAEATTVAPEERADDAAAPPDEPTPVELDEVRAEVLAALRQTLGEEAVVAHWARERGDLWVRVRPQDWRATAEAARALGFTYFCFLSAVDWLPSPFGKSEEGGSRTLEDVRARIEGATLEHGVTGGETRFQLLARVYSIARRTGLVLKADLPEAATPAEPTGAPAAGPVADTWTGVYPGANWHEREAHEMFGIGFAGHPYLEKLYLPGAFEGHPLRKDFPLLAREVKPWPGIVDVEAMPGEPEQPGGDTTETEGATA